nr:hypothetical protein [Clostridiales bacterium]
MEIKRIFKKVFGVTLALAMVITTFFFTDLGFVMKASAATAGSYWVWIDTIVSDSCGCHDAEFKVYYKSNNGTGTESSHTFQGPGKSMTFDGTGGDDFQGTLAGFPTKVVY